MSAGTSDFKHRLVDRMTIHVDTENLQHEIAYSRLREILDGYDILIDALEDDRAYNADDTRTHQRKSAEAKSSHKLYLAPATAGSYACEALLYDDSELGKQASPIFGEGFTRMLKVMDAVSEGDKAKFTERVPSRFARSQVLSGMKKVTPHAGEKITVTAGLEHTVTENLRQADVIPFKELEPYDDSYVDAEIIGTIASVDFENRKLNLRIHGASKKFSIPYDAEIEDRLMESRHKTMTVKCKVRYNLNGDIDDVQDADGIEELVLKPIEIKTFKADGITHTFKSPISVEVSLDETGQVYLGIFEPLGLCVYATHQDELREEVLNDLAWRWSEIAVADNETLASDALAIKEAFIKLVGD